MVLLVVPVVSEADAGATSATAVVPGTYTFYNVTSQGRRLDRFTVSLNGDGSGLYARGYTVTWIQPTDTTIAVTITVNATGAWATRTARINARGFGSKRRPGTITTPQGDSGY